MAIMGEIYSSAYLTISAMGAAGCNEGFLTPQQDLYFPVSYRGSDGVIYQIKMSRNQDQMEQTAHALEEGNPLSNRGWTFQETVLSPRVLFYSSIQPYWRCPHSSKEAGGKPFREFFSSTGLSRIQPMINSLEKRKMFDFEWRLIA
jgi:hypothetical protein